MSSLSNNPTKLGNGIIHQSARPMTVCRDSHGDVWLCDADVDHNRPYSEQSCWSYDRVWFEREG